MCILAFHTMIKKNQHTRQGINIACPALEPNIYINVIMMRRKMETCLWPIDLYGINSYT